MWSPLRAGMRAQATDVDDYASATLLEVWQAYFDAVERAVEDNGGDGSPILERHLLERLLSAHCRVVDENVDASEALDRGGDHLLHRLRVGYVSDDGKRLAACPLDLARDGLSFLQVRPGIDDDGRATCAERERNPSADVASGAGDDRDAAFEFLVRHLYCSPRCCPRPRRLRIQSRRSRW